MSCNNPKKYTGTNTNSGANRPVSDFFKPLTDDKFSVLDIRIVISTVALIVAVLALIKGKK